jgi:TPR repeat protein
MKARGIAAVSLSCALFLVCAHAQESDAPQMPFSELKARAEKGDAWAQGWLGSRYANGQGQETNLVEAVNWYRKAANQNDPWALGLMGYCYEHGQGVETNLEQAVKWYRKAAGFNNAWARFTLGICYETGRGVEHDHKEALRQYRMAAEQNYALAQYHVGIHYLFSETNYAEAVRWLQKAADNRNEWAQFYLGNCYSSGQGVKTNAVEAAAWLSLSAETYKPAMTNRDNLVKQMSAEQLADVQKRKEELQRRVEARGKSSQPVNR